MDTQSAINEISSIITGKQNAIRGLQKEIDQLQIAVDQLQGILDTPSQDLIKERSEKQLLVDAVSEKDTLIATITAEKDILVKEVDDLKKPQQTEVVADILIP